MNALPEYTNAFGLGVMDLRQHCTDLAYYNVQYQAQWRRLADAYSEHDPDVVLRPERPDLGKYGFRVQAVDTAGNAQPWSSFAQAETTIFANPLAVVLTFNPAILQSTAAVTVSLPAKWAAITPPGTKLTTVTVLYRFNYAPTWTLWKTFPVTQTQETFNWVSMGHGDGVYQFQATAVTVSSTAGRICQDHRGGYGRGLPVPDVPALCRQ